MQTKLLSIVVPVYNVEQYINKCLDSCIIYKNDGTLDEEKMNQLEVIIVNDGTPDRSAELSQEYTVRYPQTFRQIDQENRGHGGAWNRGLQEATGKYLRFLDSDDWLTNLDLLMDKLADTDADLVFTPMREVYVNNGEKEIFIFDDIDNTKSIDLFNFNANQQPNIADFWYVTYKSNVLLFDEPIFLEHCSYDDAVLFVAPFVKARTYVVYDVIVYNYLLGRAGQSVSDEVARKGVGMKLKNHRYMIDFWTKFNSLSILRYSQGIKNIIAGNAYSFFDDLLYLTYPESKIGHSICVSNLLASSSYKSTHKIRRFLIFPFLIYWILEKFRISILHR